MSDAVSQIGVEPSFSCPSPETPSRSCLQQRKCLLFMFDCLFIGSSIGEEYTCRFDVGKDI